MSLGTEQFTCTRQLPGPLDRAWSFITEADHLETWLGRGTLGPTGSTYEIVQTEKAPFPMPGKIIGEILESDPPNLVRFTWQHISEGADPDPEKYTTVEFKLTETAEGVDFTITHTQLRAEDIGLAKPGWLTHVEFLIDRLTGRESEPFKERFERYCEVPLPWEEVKRVHPDFNEDIL